MAPATGTPRRDVGGITYRPARNAFEVRITGRHGRQSRYSPGPTRAGQRAYDEALAAAELVKAKMLLDDELGRRPADGRITVARYLDEWLAAQRLRPATFRAYERRIELYLKPVLGRYKLIDLEKDDVTRAFKLLAERGLDKRHEGRVERLSVATLDAAYRVLKAALQDAFEDERAPRNAAKGANVDRPSTHIEPPSQDELDALFAAIGDHPWRAVFSIMRWTGARHGEVLGLTWRNVDERHGEITLVRQAGGGRLKAGGPRTVSPPAAVMAEILAIPRREIDGREIPLVFSTSSGLPLDERNVLRVFDRALDATGVAPEQGADMSKYRPHDLRHAFATLALEAGVSPVRVKEWLGHQSLAMLDRYSHVTPIGDGGTAFERIVDEWGVDGARRAFNLRVDPRPAEVPAEVPAVFVDAFANETDAG